MAIRLSGAQVTRIRESLDRYERNTYQGRNSFITPHHLAIEELVEDILEEVLPPLYLVKENGEICQLTNTPKTQSELPNVNVS